jgi:hypothetical protein
MNTENVSLLTDDTVVWGATECQLSWGALEDVLRIAGELKPGERLVAVRAEPHGMSFFTEPRPVATVNVDVEG